MEDKILEILRGAGKSYTLLFISPISRHVVDSYVETAIANKAPINFIASLNQVDVDGGYTGWSPQAFAEYVKKKLLEKCSENYPLILELDHGGPWLKDDHVARKYSYEETLNNFLRSLEAFLRAGFQILHLDATVDLEAPSGYAEPEKAAKRTIDLLTYAEDLANQVGVKEVFYEIGSDRWGYKPPEVYDIFLSNLVSEAKSKKLPLSRIVFAVAHVGTEVKLQNRVDIRTLSSFINLINSHGFKLKIHSGDFLENPEILPLTGVGGVNIGPMLAYEMYSTLVNILTVKMSESEAKKYLRLLLELITLADKYSKYTGIEKVEEYHIGLASRYVWNSQEMQSLIQEISRSLQVDVEMLVTSHLKRIMEVYIEKLKGRNLLGY
jgi:hypothetical protein